MHPGRRDNSNGNEPRPPPRPKVHDKWSSIIRTFRSNSYDDTLDQEREDDKSASMMVAANHRLLTTSDGTKS